MEIKIKTAEEFRDAHVTIEIKATQEEAWRLSRQFLPAREAENVLDQAERAGKVPALEQRIRGLEDEVASLEAQTATQALVIQGYRGYREAERAGKVPAAEIVELRRQRDAAQEAREIETRERMGVQDANKRLREELNRRFTTAQVEDAKAGAREDERARVQREVVQPLTEELDRRSTTAQTLADRIINISEAVINTEVRQALDSAIPYPDRFETMARALRRVRDIVGTPGAGTNAA